MAGAHMARALNIIGFVRISGSSRAHIELILGWFWIQNSPVPGVSHVEVWARKQLDSRWPMAESRTDDC